MDYIDLVTQAENNQGRKLTDDEVTALLFDNTDDTTVKKAQVMNVLGISTIQSLSKKLNPSLNYKSAYILLDTNNRDTTLSTDYKFTWQFLNNTSLSTGTVNVIGKVRDIVAMRLFPVKTNVVSSILGEENKNKICYNNLVTMNGNFTVLIEEFKAQSYIGRDGRRFHFVMFPAIMNLITVPGPVLGPTYVLAWLPANPYIEFTTSGKANGWFYFQKPITQFSTLTVSIGNPFDLMSLSNNGRTLIPLEFIYADDSSDN